MKARMIPSLHHGCRLLLVFLLLSLMSIVYAAPGQVRIDSLNFVNSEISTILKSLADVSGASIVVSPDVKGSITLKLRDVTVDQALQIITNMTGYGYRVTNGVYVVGKTEDGKQATAIAKDYIIVKLQVASPEDVTGALNVAYADVQVKSLPDKRLVLSGEASRLKAAKSFIEEIDQASVEPSTAAQVEMAESTYRVKTVVPWQAKQYIDDLYKGQGLNTSFAPSSRPIGQVPQAAPATNITVTKENVDAKGTGTANAQDVAQPPTLWQSDELILRGPKTVVEQALASLQKIDVSAPVVQKRCGVSKIYATQAIAYLLSQFGSRGLSVMTAPMAYNPTENGSDKSSASQIGTLVTWDKDGKVNVAEPVGDFILIGPKELVDEATTALTKIDVGPGRIERVYTLRFLQVAEVKDKLIELYGKDGLRVTVAPSKRGDTPEVLKNADAKVNEEAKTSESATMARVFDLILSGPDDVVTRAEQLLSTLDTESAQISINSEIVSIDSGSSRQLGIDWPGQISTQFTETQSGDPLRIGRIIRTPVSFTAKIDMLETHNKAKVISKPSTVVQNGREALIHVGDKILYEVLAGYSNGSPVFSTTEVDAGVTLKVLPQMSKDGVITLQITSNVSELVKFNTGASGAQLPQLRETASTTVVQVHDGETLVIGGLKQNGVIVDKKAVPILGELPVLGALFSTKTTTPSDKELLIFVTPHVLRTPETESNVTSTPSPAANAVPTADGKTTEK